MRRKRVTYRPSKSQAVFGGVVGCIFVGIGLFVAIPMAGLFGIFWTLVAVGITAMNFYQAFGKGYVGPEIHIEDEAAEQSGAPSDPQQRLRQLQTLYDQRLITQEEYDQKRQEILKEL
ncbi:SHOCT domain-containing protein [Flavonifractor hominis]|uniref:SHOCT domain-containing protein n=1 Tax=Flavonifractor hominis TaxID=3133178 RepID=A0ABV1EPT1_9FIRM